MAYKVSFSKRACNKLLKENKTIQCLLLSWLKKNLQDCVNPRIIGKQIEKYHLEKWVYRIGDYRLLSLINNEKIIILDILYK